MGKAGGKREKFRATGIRHKVGNTGELAEAEPQKILHLHHRGWTLSRGKGPSIALKLGSNRSGQNTRSCAEKWQIIQTRDWKEREMLDITKDMDPKGRDVI